MNIVQVGTNQANDDLTKIIGTTEPNILILIEPVSFHNEKINLCYNWITNKHIENIAIKTINTHNQDNLIFFLHPKDAPLYEVATPNIEHLYKHGLDWREAQQISVPCFYLSDIFKKYNLSDIDILFLDCEGMDDDIIKTIDLNFYNIKKIYFENIHLKNQEIYEYLITKGYEIIEKTGSCGWSSLAIKK